MFSFFFKRKPKYTPEDTFNALRKVTYEELRNALADEFEKQDRILTFGFYCVLDEDIASERNDKVEINVIRRRAAVLSNNGWTYKDFKEEFFRRELYA